MTLSPDTDRWAQLRNEAAVELQIILPLVQSLGYALDDIEPNYPVVFQEGKQGRKHEADFVLFSGPVHDQDTSLVVIEAKGPAAKASEDPRGQAESYAFATRAPIILICSNTDLEVWQVNASSKSTCALSMKVGDIDSRRGELDALLQKSAVIEYCKTTALKPLLDASVSFDAYETAEYQRTSSTAGFVDRRVTNPVTGQVIQATSLLEICSGGAVLSATSGFGKSSLSLTVFRDALAARWKDPAARLAAHLQFTDLGHEEPLLDFVRRRISPHKPGFTDATFTMQLRGNGMVLVCDGFDRLTPAAQETRGSELSRLLRDYPSLQLFVFSRPSVVPETALPRFTLEPLSDDELRGLIARRQPADQVHIGSSFPPFLYELCRNPLILDRTLEVWADRRAFPDRLEEVFAFWLNRVLAQPAVKAVHRSLLSTALEVIAELAASGRIQVAEAVRQLQRENLDPDLLDELISLGALLPDGFESVRFEHEALADYLKARRFAAGDRDRLREMLGIVNLQPGSFFAILLLALIRDNDLHAVLWCRLSSMDFALYMEALRYRADLSAAQPTLADLERFVHEMRDGLMQPLDGFFATLRPTVERLLTNEVGPIRLVGTASAGSVVYQFEPASDGDLVHIGMPSAEGGYSVVNLGPAGLRLDSGRLLGLQILKKQLLKAVKDRRLAGGPSWRRERMLGWLAALARDYQTSLYETSLLADWETWALPHAGRIARIGADLTLRVDDLLADLGSLRAAGIDHLDRGARPRFWATLKGEALGAAVTSHFNDAQIIYYELIAANFPQLGPLIGTFALMPLHWTVDVAQTSNGRGAMAAYRWLPVRTWDQSGVTVQLGAQPTPLNGNAHYEAVLAALAAIGRSAPHISVQLGRVDLPSLEAKWPESSAVTTAASRLGSHIENLFNAMPSGDVAGSR